MDIRTRRITFLPVLIFVFAFAVYTFYSWGFSIYILDESRNATCAREMLDAKEFFIPTFNNVLRTDKPPLHYFFMMLSYSIFGVNPFAARFFSAVFGALTILITFLYTRKFENEKTALWTTVGLLASIHLMLQFHLAVPDPYLIFFFTSSLFLFFSAVKTQNLRDALLMYVAIGLGTLSKGPVAILLPGLIFLLYLIFSKQFKWKVIKKLKPFVGVLIVLAIAVPWYVINGLHTDWEWTRGFFLKHNINRFSGEMEGHGGFFLLTFLFVFFGLFPFSLFFPQVLRTAFQNKKNNFILFNLIAGGTVVAFFSISQTKLLNYTVPSYPFLAVILGYYLSNHLTSFKQIKINYAFLLLLSVIVPIAGFVAMKYDPSLASVRMLALWSVVLPLGVLGAFFLRNNLRHFLVLIGSTSLVVACLFLGFVFPVIDKQNPVSQSIHILEGKEVAFYERFSSSYAFNLKKEIPRIEADEFDDFFRMHPDGIIISSQKHIQQIKLSNDYEILFSVKNLFETQTTVLIGLKEKE